MRRLALPFLCLCAILSVPLVSDAQRNAYQAEGEIRRLLDDAQRAYDNLELEMSDDALRRAVRLIERFGTESKSGERLAGQIYLQRGILIHVKDKDTRATVNDFTLALQYDPDIRLDPQVATPSLQRLFDQARRQVRTRRDERRSDDYRRDDRGGGSAGAGYYDPTPRGGGYQDRRRDDRGGGGYRDDDRGRYDDRRGRDDYGRGSDRRDDRGSFQDDRRGRDRGSRDRGGRSRGRDRFREDDKLSHNPPRRAESERRLSLKVTVADYFYRDVARVFLYFKTARSRQMQKLEMLAERRGNDFSTNIPARFMMGSRVTYYFQAEDRRQSVIATLGSVREPFEIRIDGDSLGADSFATGSSLSGGGGRRRSNRTYFSLSVNLGTGMGWVKTIAKPVTNPGAKLKNPGLALAPFHGLIEADFWLSETMTLGAYARVQVIEPAYLGGGRLKYVVKDDDPHRVLLRFGGGVGQVRHLVKLGDRLDTTLEGLYHISLGMTYAYRISSLMSFVLSPDYFQIFGESPSYHLDVNLGLSLNF